MSPAKIAELAADLGCRLASELVPVDSTDDRVTFAPTAADYRRAMKELHAVAVYIAGPEFPVRVGLGVNTCEANPVCIGITQNPRNLKAVAQQWNWHTIAIHGLIWVEGRDEAEAKARATDLKTRIENALDFRRCHRMNRFFDIAPMQAVALALEVGQAARLPVYDEAERWRRLERLVGDGVKRLGRARG